MKLRLIMNPGSCSGRGRLRWARWEAGLRAAGVPVEALLTGGPGDACRLAREAVAVDTVVAVGGDGTINEVLDGVIQAGRPDLRMGVLYAGTSPDFCRFHRIPVEPDAALACLLAGQTSRVDVARIRYDGPDGAPLEAHFGCGCNIGLGPSIARCANRLRRFLGDAAGTATAALLSLLANRAVPLTVEADGEPLALGPVNNLSILKNPYIASGLRVRIEAAPDDGRLWLVAVHGKGTLGLCALLPRFYTGYAVRDPAVAVKACRRIVIRAERPCELEFDGDPRGFLPADIRILPQALTLIGGAA